MTGAPGSGERAHLVKNRRTMMNTNQPAAKDLGRHAVDQGPSAAAEGLETAAAALREGVDGLPGGDRVKDFARAATDRLSSGADFLRSRDPERIMADITGLLEDIRGEKAPAVRFDPKSAGVTSIGNPHAEQRKKKGRR